MEWCYIGPMVDLRVIMGAPKEAQKYAILLECLIETLADSDCVFPGVANYVKHHIDNHLEFASKGLGPAVEATVKADARHLCALMSSRLG